MGGLVLEDQQLRVHKNGVKFTISKSYLDSEKLSPDRPYTLLILPEPVDFAVVISYFDPLKGPKPLYVYPEKILTIEQRSAMANLMGDESPGWFTRQTAGFAAMNLMFEIPSNWTRISKEVLLVSVASQRPFDWNLEERAQETCKKLEDQIRSLPEGYKAFYSYQAPQITNGDVDQMRELRASIRQFVKDAYQTLQE